MIVKCEKGKHYYDTAKHRICPFCSIVYEKNVTALQKNKYTEEALTETETMHDSDRKVTEDSV